MAATHVSLRYFILGLLTRQPMSGYDIKHFLKGLSWLIGSPSSGSLYPTLRALLNDGLVTVEVIVRQDRPPKKIYTITARGRHELAQWFEQPVSPRTSSMKAFIMRLILTSNYSPAGLIAHLQQRRSEVAGYQLVLEQTAAALDGGADLGQRLALDYGMAIARSELAWLDRTLNQMFQHPALGQVVEDELAQDVVRDPRLGSHL